MRKIPLVLVLFAIGCDDEMTMVGSPDLAVSADLARQIGMDSTVPTFASTLFDSGHQNNDVTVDLPSGLYSKVTMHVELGCPQNRCDIWDRTASIGVVLPAGDDAGTEQVIEIGRFITTYGVKGAWDIDVTDLQTLLAGTKKLRGHIETWVSAGSTSGNGWLLTSHLDYVGGVPSPEPVAVIPLAWHDFQIGNPAFPVAQAVPPQAVVLPASATGAAVRVTVTGHGQGNLDNCGEFCPKDHTVLVDGQKVVTQTIWRDDCDQNPIHQKGSWQYPRAGWCPGADVKPWRVDLGARPQTFTVGYAIDPYVNTCSPESCSVLDCSLGTGCAYDGGNHTPPMYAFSALVIAYR
jgi:hypothetical protein